MADENAPITETYLSPAKVSERYSGNISVKTLANWRTPSGGKQGPSWMKLGGRVLYRLSDLLEWERLSLTDAQNEKTPNYDTIYALAKAMINSDIPKESPSRSAKPTKRKRKQEKKR